MFSFFGRNRTATKLSVKEFELWVKEKQVGVFITQERLVCKGTFDAKSQQEADEFARKQGGHATVKMDR